MPIQLAPPRLHLIANLWTLTDHPSSGREWSLVRKLAALKESGFDGFTDALGPEHARLAEKLGLSAIGYFACSRPSIFRSLIRRNRDGGALRINVQLGDHDTPVESAIAMAVSLNEEAEALGIPCDIEVHRDTCTETPEKTYAIAAGFKKVTGRLLPMTWDFSHFAVVKHLAPPFWDRLLSRASLLRQARQFHFRPFNGHHCQIPVTDGCGRLSTEFTQWLPFLEKTFALILAGKNSGQDIYACPEMGPVRGGYNLAQLPCSWEDAKILRLIIRQTWDDLIAALKREEA